MPAEPLDTLGKVERFFELVGAKQSPKINMDQMMEQFASTIPEGKATDALTEHDVRDGIIWALRSAGRGIFLDHGESDAVEHQCNGFIDHLIGRPDHYWKKDGTLVSLGWGDWGEIGFECSGDLVDEGLAAFAEWIRKDNVRVRLINVTTHADYFFAFTCAVSEVNECIGLLGDLGIEAQVIGAPTPLPPVRDIHAEISRYLEQTYGFSTGGHAKRLFRMFDDHKGVTVQMKGDGSTAGVDIHFGVIRMDTNRLKGDVFEFDFKNAPMLEEPGNIFNYDIPGSFTSIDHEWSEIQEWLDRWIPELLQAGTDDDFLREKLQLGPSSDRLQMLFFDNLLNGTATADDPWFNGRQSPERLERARAWMQQHPNGTRAR